MSTVIAVKDAPTIVCPAWCTVPTELHVADLQQQEGFVIHWSAEHAPAGPVRVWHGSSRYVDGTLDPTDPPVIYAQGAENGISIEAAEALAGALLGAVAQARCERQAEREC